MTENEEQQFKAYLQRGSELFVARRYRAACEAFTNAIHINPEHTTGYEYRIGALEALERYDEAVADYKKLIERCESSIQKAKNDKNGWACYSWQSSMVKYLNDLGFCYRNMGKYASADECFSRANLLQKEIYK